jgi:hypothetical protein
MARTQPKDEPVCGGENIQLLETHFRPVRDWIRSGCTTNSSQTVGEQVQCNNTVEDSTGAGRVDQPICHHIITPLIYDTSTMWGVLTRNVFLDLQSPTKQITRAQKTQVSQNFIR